MPEITSQNSQVDLQSTTLDAWNQQINADLNNTATKNIKSKRRFNQRSLDQQMRGTQKFKELIYSEYGLVDKEGQLEGSQGTQGGRNNDYEDIKVQQIGLGSFQAS